ncbi:MAG: redox-sensing transcriptional repressor Rex [Propionibacteriaceae bacterium]
MSNETVPAATIARIPNYLRVLSRLADQGKITVSSAELAQAAGVQSALLRRDLSWFGTFGTRGVGYDVTTLRASLGSHVGAAQSWPLVLIGAGNLGTALARQFSQPPFELAALLDVDPRIIGTKRAGITVQCQTTLSEVVATTGASIGVIATPPDTAQGTCDALVASGVVSILNFAPTLLQVPQGVLLRTVDLVQELQILAFHESHRAL